MPAAYRFARPTAGVVWERGVFLSLTNHELPQFTDAWNVNRFFFFCSFFHPISLLQLDADLAHPPRRYQLFNLLLRDPGPVDAPVAEAWTRCLESAGRGG